MTNKEKLLTVEMLKLASHYFSNHNCNDLDERLANDWTKQEQEDFMKDYFKIKNEYPDSDIKTFLDLGDSILMDHLANKLLKEITEH